MILFYIYRHAPCSWHSLWGAGSTVQEILGAAFEELLASDANLFSQQLLTTLLIRFETILMLTTQLYSPVLDHA